MRIISPLPFSLMAVLFLTFVSTAIAADIPKRPSDVQRITITELQTLQTNSVKIIFIDTRTPGQWQQAKDKIPGAIRVTSRSELQKLKAEVPPDTEIITYCT